MGSKEKMIQKIGRRQKERKEKKNMEKRWKRVK